MRFLEWLLGMRLRWVDSVNGGLILGYGAIAALVYDKHMPHTPQHVRWGLMAVCVLGLLGWWLMLRRSKAYALEATSRIATAAQGYVELQGHGSPSVGGSICVSPITRRPCIWYRTTLYRRSLLGRDWNLTDEGECLESFVLDDGSGTCVVYPQDAEIVGMTNITTEQGNERWIEELLLPHARLTVLGELQTDGGGAPDNSEEQAVGDLLVQWKSDPKSLLQRFDLNRDGVIDLKEWELARKLAQGTVRRQRANTPPAPTVNTLRAPASGALFLISTYSPQQARWYFLAWGGLHLLLAVGAMVVVSKLHIAL